MGIIEQTTALLSNYTFVQFYLIGSLGSILFDLSLYFNKDLGLSARRKKEKNKLRTGCVYIVSRTVYSSVMGGILAIGVDHNLFVAFIAGFLSSLFFTFVLKTIILKSTKKEFWLIVSKMIFSLIGTPLKKVVILLETLSGAKENNDRDK